jgi:hypothetical protein
MLRDPTENVSIVAAHEELDAKSPNRSKAERQP